MLRNTLAAYRAQLIAKGVRPQPSGATAPDYCDAARHVPL
jgi:hypothetical protein